MTLMAVRSVSVLDRWDPFGEFDDLHRRPGRWSPAAAVRETDDAYLVEVQLPGLKRRDVTVEVTGSEVAVTGEAGRRGLFRHRARRAGEFACRVTLPDEVDTDAVSAALARGVLTVRAPKREFARRRRIAVDSTRS
jgi:HSP20 family protein